MKTCGKCIHIGYDEVLDDYYCEVTGDFVMIEDGCNYWSDYVDPPKYCLADECDVE